MVSLSPYLRVLLLFWAGFVTQENLFAENDTLLAYTSVMEADSMLDNYYDSEEILQKYKDAEKVLFEGKAFSSYIHCLNGLGLIHRRLENFQTSDSLFRLALQMGETLLPPFHRDVAKTHLYLGRAMTGKGNYAEAEVHLKKALKFYDPLGRDPKLTKATIRRSLGMLYIRSGKYDLADQYLSEAEALHEKTPGKYRIERSRLLITRAIFFERKSDFNKSLELNEKALEIRLTHLRKDHPLIATAYANLAESYRNMGRLSEALDLNKKGMKIELQVSGEKHSRIADYYYRLGSIVLRMGNYDEAWEYHKKALDMRLELLGEVHPRVAASYNLLAYLANEKKDLDLAMEYCKKSLEIRQEIYGEHHPDVALAYTNLGNLYWEKGDYEKSLEFQLHATRIKLKTLGENHVDVALTYENTANLYFRKGDIDRAAEYYSKALSIDRQAYGEVHHRTAKGYNHLGTCFMKKGDMDQALFYLNKALNLQIKVFGEVHHAVAASYKDIAVLYRELNQNEKALDFFLKALEIYKANLGPDHAFVAQTHRRIAETLDKTGNYPEALKWAQEALDLLTDEQKLPEILVKPGTHLISQSSSILSILKTKARILSHDDALPDNLTESLKAYRLASSLIDWMRIGFERDGSKEELAEKAMEVYEEGIDVAFKLYKETGQREFLETAFHFAEKNKSLILKEGMQERSALKIAGIDAEFIEQEQNLKGRLALYSGKLSEEKKKKEKADAQKIELWEGKLFSLKQEYSELKTHLEQNFPEYYQLKYDLSVPKISDLQLALGKEEILVEYFAGDSNLSIFLISTGEIRAFHFPIAESFRENAQFLRAVLAEPSGKVADFQQAAFSLYEKLFSPFDEWVSGKKVMIIPDGYLYYLPFEVLVDSEQSANSWLDLAYLMKKYRISYTYSSALWLENQLSERRRSSAGFGAFAPDFSQKSQWATAMPARDSVRGTLANLPGALNEVRSLGEFMNGHYFTGAEASEFVFRKKANQFGILHLATHAWMDNRNPMNSSLYFSLVNPNPADSTAENIKGENDGVLHAWELYNMSLESQMIVLSACNTGTGKLQRGEGVMSLGRAFTFAGIPSVVMSLWPASDNSTSGIMKSFYRELRSGKTKEEALRIAKLEYLRNSDELTAHPYFWAGFLLQGDTQPLSGSGSNAAFWLGAVLILLAGIVLLLRMRGKLSS